MSSAHDDLTEQIFGAWPDETEEETETPEAEAELETEATEETEEQPEAEAETEETEEAPAEETEEEAEEEEPEVTAETIELSLADPAVLAYVKRYGDPEKALQAAVELTRRLNEQGFEKNRLADRVRELEEEAQQANAFPGVTVLNEEQRVWVESAVESGNARAYVQEAVKAGEYELARAVCEQLSEETPYDASRLAHYVDQAELQNVQRAQVATQQEMVVDHGALMEVLVANFPQMPDYEEQMVSTLASLGQNHPLAEDARSNDPETAARGIIGIFEIARATNLKTAAVRSQVKKQKSDEAESVRAEGVVSTGQATPASSETPRPTKLGPGLTMEQLDEAWQ